VAGKAGTRGAPTRGDAANMLTALVAMANAKANEGEKDRGPMDYSVEHAGRKIILPSEPSPLGLMEAAEILEQMHEEQEQDVAISEIIRGAHYVDGLVAFTDAMETVFGWTRAVPTPTMFGPVPPVFVDVPISTTESRRVLSGRFEMPNVKGFVQVGSTNEKGVTVFQIQGKTIRKFQPLFEALAEETRRLVRENSIFRNKSFELLFNDEGRISDDAPRFIDLSGTETPIFSHETEKAVQANILTPIQHSQRCRDMRIPLKRGVLLEGPYGTGKTLVSRQAGQEAIKHGWTHITIREPQNLAPTLEFARKFQPCVVFVEDIDREMEGEDRTVRIDNILNTLDGVDSKNSEVMVVFTSNHAENINRAMMRPGRLDAVISVQNPDASAALRLAQVYGGPLLDPNADYAPAGEAMAGQSPAVIREIVERAKLYAMDEITGSDTFFLSPAALVDSNATMVRQLALLEPKAEKPQDAGAAFIQAVADATLEMVENGRRQPDATLGGVNSKVDRLVKAVC
jgi:hypothetical protein